MVEIMSQHVDAFVDIMMVEVRGRKTPLLANGVLRSMGGGWG